MQSDYWLWISYIDTTSDESCSPERAASYHASGSRYRGEVEPSAADGVITNATHIGRPRWVEHPDWHTASWVTPDRNRYEGRPLEYLAMLAAMRSLEKNGQEVRVVFWFDN